MTIERAQTSGAAAASATVTGSATPLPSTTPPPSATPTRSAADRRILELHSDAFTDATVAALRARLSTPADGAVVLFVGQTRESPGTPAPGEEGAAAQFAGEAVEELEYEAFEEMALAVLAQIADEIEARFGVSRLAILHRTGAVPLGEASVVVAAAAPHRGAAFDAARYAIDELKARAPIWKSEHFEGGSVWIGAPARQGPESGTARAAQRGPESGTARAAQRGPERGTGRGAERGPERGTARAAERAPERATQRGTRHAPERDIHRDQDQEPRA